MANAHDASGLSTADSLSNNTGQFNESRIFSSWASASGGYSSLNLKVNSLCSVTGNIGSQESNCAIRYSTNSGSTWTVVRSSTTASSGTGWSQGTDSVSLSPGQSLSALRVDVCLTVGDGFGFGIIEVWDIWTEGILIPPPAAPTSLSVTPAANGLSNGLAWTDNAGVNATSYQINKCAGASCAPTSYSTGLASGSTSFNDASGVSPGTIYGYQTCAVNSGGTSCSTTTFATTPSAPAAPSALSLSFSNTSITASWTNNAGNATSNILQRCLGGGCTPADFVTLGPSITTFTDTAVNQKSSYTYNVVASNAVGRSAGAGTKTIIGLGHQDGHTNHKIAQ